MTHASHSYLLPFVGVAAAMLGVLLLFGLGASARPYLPWSLLALGAAALASTAAFHHWHWQLRRPSGTTGDPRPLVHPPLHPGPPAAAFAHEPLPSEHGHASPHSGIGRAALSAAAQAAERMWTQWETPVTASLGVPLAGPVAETAYVPPSPAAPTPFARRDRDLVIATVPDGSSAIAPPPRPSWTDLESPAVIPRSPLRSGGYARSRAGLRRRIPYSEAELNALFPPEVPAAVVSVLPLASAEISPIPLLGPSLALEPEAAVVSLITSPAPRTSPVVGPLRDVPTAPAATDHPSGRYRILPSLLHLRDPLYVETIHPIPPHLRAIARPRGTAAPAPRPSAGAKPPCCVGCLRSLTGFRAWVICPGCHQPLCRRCLGASFLASTEGYCSQCRPWHGRVAS
jgi:hypothetical protein